MTNKIDQKSVPSFVKDITFTQESFDFFKKLILTGAGIEITEKKKLLLYNRLAPRLRELHLNNMDEYCSYAQRNNELEKIIDLVTNPSTSFFREYHHFEFLTRYITQLLTQKNEVNIWSAGCATGEEPYSIAIVANELIKNRLNKKINITATDISSSSLAIARKGIYDIDKVSILTKEQLQCFYKGVEENAGLVKVSDKIRKMVNFYTLNLIDSYTMPEKFDIIFCRNVIIYFQDDVATKVLARLETFLLPRGVLILGSSETLHAFRDRFTSIDKTVYEKTI